MLSLEKLYITGKFLIMVWLYKGVLCVGDDGIVDILIVWILKPEG